MSVAVGSYVTPHTPSHSALRYSSYILTEVDPSCMVLTYDQEVNE